MNYLPPIDDLRFLLTRTFDFSPLAALYADHGLDEDFTLHLLDEAGKFCAEVLAPLNQSGDAIGSTLENGLVTTPPGFADAYKAFVEAGWGSLAGDPEYGGQGLPRTLKLLIDEMLSGANLSFGLFPGLTQGAAEALAAHGSDELKRIWLPKMISGEWTGAMALTESNAGTDLGLLRTRAIPNGDGSYAVTGTKIFISSGDHDFGGNIVHLVLARLPDAPAGVKGISLFLVPKFLLDANGELGARNGMSVGKLEDKMGIHAQPTCVMNYDGATGWLIGEAGRGLNAMFVMMNAERLFVGLQGLGVAQAAYDAAAAYAKDRLQGRGVGATSAPAPIIHHPDVRRMLLGIRAFTEAGRALALWTAMQMDIAHCHPDADVRASADGFVSLLTPVIKAAFTDFGFESAVQAQQVFGGHGYVAEYGVEQLVRDARIAQIYEGTNGVQALDLVARKLTFEDGKLVHRFLDLVAGELADAKGKVDDAVLSPAVSALGLLRAVTENVQAKSADAAETGAAASDYLRLFALVCFGWMWVRMAVPAAGGATAQDQGKLAVAHFFAARMLPQTVALGLTVQAGASSIMALPGELF